MKIKFNASDENPTEVTITFADGTEATIRERFPMCRTCGKRQSAIYHDGSLEGNDFLRCVRCAMSAEIEAFRAAAFALSAKWQELDGAHNYAESGMEAMDEPSWLPMSMDEFAMEVAAWEERTR